MTQSKSADQAKSYYVAGLTREDYYTERQELEGAWGGKGAGLLGLDGKVGSDEFYDLCDNRDPVTGARLTPRTKDVRTVGYDINFHCPKSVSAMYVHSKDERILGAFRQAVGDTMHEMEAEMQTRVRMGGAQEKRVTGNMIWAEFTHMTARPVGGKPDPHLHAHCFAFNATYDPTEERWKAGHFGDLKRDAPYFEAAFHARLAGHVRDLGYGVEARGKFWEIDGVPQSVIDKYSQRRDQIEALAEQLGISDAAEKDRLGATSREKKVKTSMEDLSKEWASRLTPEEKAAMDVARHSGHGAEDSGRDENLAQRAIDHSLTHVFERVSVASEKNVLEAALRHGVGRITVEEAKAAFAADSRIVGRVVDGERRCTTLEVRDQEKDIVAFAKETRGTLEPLKTTAHEFQDKRLHEEQRLVVEHVLSSRDQVTMFRGKPGTGKTTLMTETVDAINAAGFSVTALAPTAESSRVALRESGFPMANTVEGFLQSAAKQKQARGQVIWVDEAGLLSARLMQRLFDVAKAQGCRIVLAGDPGQHSAVERGDAMRTLETHAGLPVPQVTKIVRQKEATYRRAVEAMSRGDVDKAFAALEKLNAFTEEKDIGRLHDRVAKEYVGLLRSGKEALIIAPQHQEGMAITGKVRAELRTVGQIKGNDQAVLRLTNLKLTEAERKEPRYYQQGQLVQFVQNAPGFKRGERWIVAECKREQVTVENAAGEKKLLPLSKSSRFQLYRVDKMSLAQGDRVRVTNNSFAKTGHRLDNGTLHTVAGVRANGEVELKNKAVLPAGFGHLTHGYYVTSHSSQSKTVDWTLLAQSSMSFNAGSREQMNVSLSRGRDGIRIYTDDKAKLRTCANRDAARGSALDFLGSEKMSEKRADKREVIMGDMNRWWSSWQKSLARGRMSERSREADRCKDATTGVSKGRRRGLGLEISL
ncbi:MAG: MobF family relaxase [Chthoniobacter sp.]|nr:MobF family relaxase [Chthoniobacter sp.]